MSVKLATYMDVPVVVRDANGVDSLEELVLLLLNHLIESLGSRLLHALKAHEQVDGELDPESLVCLDHVDPAEDLTRQG
jgi:hypothetical protein